MMGEALVSGLFVELVLLGVGCQWESKVGGGSCKGLRPHVQNHTGLRAVLEHLLSDILRLHISK